MHFVILYRYWLYYVLQNELLNVELMQCRVIETETHAHSSDYALQFTYCYCMYQSKMCWDRSKWYRGNCCGSRGDPGRGQAKSDITHKLMFQADKVTKCAKWCYVHSSHESVLVVSCVQQIYEALEALYSLCLS